MRLDAYIRVSKLNGRGGESFISPDVQRSHIERWADLRGVTVAKWHEDLDVSGGTLARPGLDAVMSRIRAGKTGGLVVAKLDRLSRAGVADALKLVEEVHDAGGHIAAVDLGVDPTTPGGELMLTLLLALARMQRRQIADAWNDATNRAVARGVHTVVPYGYKRGRDKRLVPDAARADLVQRIFTMRAAGRSWKTITDEVNATGVRPLRAEAWSLPAVKRIVGSRAYLGEAFYGAHRTVNAHEPLVSEQDWKAAQVNTGARQPRRADGGALLAGLVRCAGCSYAMAGSRSRELRVYKCPVRHGGGRCQAPASITQHILDEHVERLFLARFGDLAFEVVHESASAAALNAEVERCERELVAWRDDTRIRETVGDEHYLAGLSVRVTALQTALAEQEAMRERHDFKLAESVEVWPALDRLERRQVLGAGIDAVFVRNVGGRSVPVESRTRVLWHGEAHDGLPRQGRPSSITPFEWT